MQEQKVLQQILSKSNKNAQDMLKVILKVRNNSLSYPDLVLEYGLKLIRHHKNQIENEYYIVIEELFHAALALQMIPLANNCLQKLQIQFPESPKINLFQTLLLDSAGNSENLNLLLEQNLSQNLSDYDSKKRKIQLFRIHGNHNDFVNQMNDYLQENPNDAEAWLELADFYCEQLCYNKALYCYEEVLLLYPKRYIYMMRIAEIYYTLGGKENFLNARNYYSFVLNKMQNNFRCLWGLILTCQKLKQIDQNDTKNNSLLEVSTEMLKKFYKEKKMSKFIENIEFNK